MWHRRLLASLLLCCTSTVFANVVVAGQVVSRFRGPGSVELNLTSSGVIAASLPVSASGSSAYAFGDSAAGVLRSSSFAAAPADPNDLSHYISASSSVQLSEVLTFSGQDSFQGSLDVTVLGHFTLDQFQSAIPSEHAFAQVSLGFTGLSLLNVDQVVPVPINCPTAFSCEEVRLVAHLPYAVDSTHRSFSLKIELDTYAYLGASADFGHSAYLRLSGLPAGITYASSSGQFLADPLPIPQVPEPGRAWLIASGLMLLATRWARQRA